MRPARLRWDLEGLALRLHDAQCAFEKRPESGVMADRFPAGIVAKLVVADPAEIERPLDDPDGLIPIFEQSVDPGDVRLAVRGLREPLSLDVKVAVNQLPQPCLGPFRGRPAGPDRAGKRQRESAGRLGGRNTVGRLCRQGDGQPFNHVRLPVHRR